MRYLPSVELGYDSDYLPRDQAQLITRVLPDSPAEQAGMKPGDRLIAIDGLPLADASFQARAWGVGTTPATPSGSRCSGRASRRHASSTARSAAASREARRPVFPGTSPARSSTRIRFRSSWSGSQCLFLRVADSKAWLLALIFAGMATTPAFPDSIGVFGARAPSFHPALPGDSHRPVRAPLLLLLRRVPHAVVAGSADALAEMGRARHRGRGRVRRRAHGLHPAASVLLPRLLGQKLADQIATWWLLGLLTLGMASLAINFVHTPDRETRRKIRVIFWGTVVALTPNVVGVAASTFFGYREPDWLSAVRAVFAFLLPLSLAYAVVKHRVLDVPVLLRRSARYLLVQRGFTILLALSSVAATLAFSLWLAPSLAPLVQVAQPAGIGAGAAFGTLLLWGGSLIDRRVSERIYCAFFRQTYDARTILQDLAGKARTVTGRAELAALLHRHVADALQPTALAVYLWRPRRLVEPHGRRVAVGANDAAGGHTVARRTRPASPDGGRWRRADGRDGARVRAARPRFPGADSVGRAGRILGLLALGVRLSEEPYSREDDTLLAVVANQAALALDNLALAEQMADRLEAERRHGSRLRLRRRCSSSCFRNGCRLLRLSTTRARAPRLGPSGATTTTSSTSDSDTSGSVLADVSGNTALPLINLLIVRSHSAMAAGDHEAMLKAANDLFHDSTAPNRFATMFFAKYDDATGEIPCN